MKLTCFVIAAMLLPFFAKAQANYHDGYIIKNNSDTVKGYINVRDWLYNPQSVEFKPAGESQTASVFSAEDIKEVSAGNGITYVTYTGKISKNKNIYPGLDIGLDSTATTGTFF